MWQSKRLPRGGCDNFLPRSSSGGSRHPPAPSRSLLTEGACLPCFSVGH